jgi:hypothetical protein
MIRCLDVEIALGLPSAFEVQLCNLTTSCHHLEEPKQILDPQALPTSSFVYRYCTQVTHSLQLVTHWNYHLLRMRCETAATNKDNVENE